MLRRPPSCREWSIVLTHSASPWSTPSTICGIRITRTAEVHDEQLDVLVPAAAELVTLTGGAAREIRQRWGREAQVVGHPHVVDLKTMAAFPSI